MISNSSFLLLPVSSISCYLSVEHTLAFWVTRKIWDSKLSNLLLWHAKTWDTNNVVSSSFQILLKFHPSFHTSYHGEDYKVRFNFNRTPLRRCHFALDYTMKQLGSDILFPSRLRLQLPQVCYIDPEAQNLIKNWRNYTSRSHHQSSLLANDTNKLSLAPDDKDGLVLKKFKKGVLMGDTKEELPGEVLGTSFKSKSCYIMPVLPLSSASKKSKLYFF